MTGLLLVTTGCAFLTSEQRQQVDGLYDDTRETLERVRVATRDTPESALSDSITALDAILTYTDQIRTDPDRFNKDTVDAYALKIRIINENIDRLDDLTLETDVSFPLGTYKMINVAPISRTRLDELAVSVAESIVALGNQYPEYTLNLIIKTVGFTDESQVLPSSHLEKKISSDLSGNEMKQSGVARRQTNNRVLSSYRAYSLNSYMAQQVTALMESKYMASKQKFSIEPVIVGKGESLPGGKGGKGGRGDKVYKSNDPRRRICIISPFVEVIP